MWGTSIGTLNILTKSNDALSSAIWQRNKNYGDEWNLAEVQLSSNNQDYQVAFEGIVGSSFYGDIAIDDVQVEARTCPKSGFCDFESKNRFCTWFNIQSKKIMIKNIIHILNNFNRLYFG